MASRGDIRPAPQLSTRRKAFFSLLVVVLLAGLVEAASRVVWWRLERDALRSHYQKGEAVLANDAINYMKVPDGVYGYKIRPGFHNDANTINFQGFRQREQVTERRTPGTLRIVCLGESTTLGTSDESNYPTLLRNILDKDAVGYQRYEVINAGVPGWLSDQIALRVHHQIADLVPDVAILYIGWNDFQTYDPLRPVAIESSFVLGFGGTPWTQYAASASKTVALLSGLWARQRPAGPTAADYRDALAHATPPGQRYRFLSRNLSDIVDGLKSRNASMKIFVCTLVGIWPHRPPDGKLTVPFWVDEHHVTPAQAAFFVEELNDQLRRFAAAHDASIVDAAEIFGPLDRARLQWDFAHMYQDGYELLAWAMLDALRSSGVVTARKDDRYQELLSAYRLP